MKKVLGFIFVIMIVFSFSACDNIEKENSNSSYTESALLSSENSSLSTENSGFSDDSGNTENSDLYKENFPSYEEVQAEYPDKTVLVWAIVRTGYESHAPFPSAKLNDYLDEQGYDFAVCFKPVYYAFTDEVFPDPMLTEVKELLGDGEQIDIISPMNYDEFVFDGLYEPLDEYSETEIGRGLYNAFPEKFWESMRINGGIYGLCGDMAVVFSPDRGYYVNAELAEKYGYDVTKPILEQLDILKAVKENEKNTDIFSTHLELDNIVSFVNVKMLSSAVYWNSDTHSAELSIDNPQYIEWLRLFDTLKNENLLNNLLKNNKDNFFIMSDTVCGGIGYADMKPIDVDYFGNTVTAIPVFTPYSTMRTAPIATGICSKSEYKEKAFKLLAKIFTDPDLNNLMVYGVEGENYTLENGVIKEIAFPAGTNMFNVNPFNTYRFANQMICHRSEYNLFAPEQYTNIFEKSEVYEDIDFTLDPQSIISELNAEYIAADNISLSDKDRTFDDVLAEYREGLYAAGVQKIIDECNKQYEEYTEKKDEKVS